MRSGRAAHRSPHYLGKAPLKHSKRAKCRRSADMRTCIRRCDGRRRETRDGMRKRRFIETRETEKRRITLAPSKHSSNWRTQARPKKDHLYGEYTRFTANSKESNHACNADEEGDSRKSAIFDLCIPHRGCASLRYPKITSSHANTSSGL